MKQHFIFIVAILLASSYYYSPKPVFADSCTAACTGGGGTCVKCTFCSWVATGIAPCPPVGPYCSYSCDPNALCCQYNSPIGNCTVCDTTGTCYYTGCPAPTGGGGGGATATPVPPGSTPTPVVPGTITAVAKQVSPSDITCTAVHNSTTGVTGTTFGFTASSTSQPAPQTQSGVTPVIFSSVTPGTYTLTASPPQTGL